MRTNIWHLWETWESNFYTFSPMDSQNFFPVPEGLNRDELAQWCKEANVKHVFGTLNVAGNYVNRYDEAAAPEGIDLPSGVYEYTYSMETPCNRLIPISVRDDMFVKTEEVYTEILQELDAFLKNEALYRELGCIYKRSILMYGDPGHGKTAIIRNVIKEKLPKDAVVVFFNRAPSIDFIVKVSNSLGNRLKIFVFEELLLMLSNPEQVQEFLEFMDGEKSLDGAFMFGTTNYPEKLPENLTNRPSRWDRVIKMGGLNAEGKSKLIQHYLKREPTSEELALVKEFSAAAIKEICFMVRLHDVSFVEAVDKMNKHIKLVKNEFVERGTMGLGVKN